MWGKIKSLLLGDPTPPGLISHAMQVRAEHIADTEIFVASAKLVKAARIAHPGWTRIEITPRTDAQGGVNIKIHFPHTEVPITKTTGMKTSETSI